MNMDILKSSYKDFIFIITIRNGAKIEVPSGRMNSIIVDVDSSNFYDEQIIILELDNGTTIKAHRRDLLIELIDESRKILQVL